MSKFLERLCVRCHRAVGTSRHEVLNDYLCSNCERQQSYYAANDLHVGQPCLSPGFSVEFEVSAPSEEQVRRALILLLHQFQRTYDSTVADEYKSPIYHSLRVFRRPLVVLHSLRDLVNEQCGTHLHVAFTEKCALLPIREEVFGPLIDHLQLYPDETVWFWGRTFTPYARADLSTESKYGCINLWTRYETIEFRLPRFREALQYLTIVRFCRQVTTQLTAYLQCENSQKMQASNSIRSPEQLGERLLACYQRAVKQASSERTMVLCADSHS